MSMRPHATGTNSLGVPRRLRKVDAVESAERRRSSRGGAQVVVKVLLLVLRQRRRHTRVHQHARVGELLLVLLLIGAVAARQRL